MSVRRVILSVVLAVICLQTPLLSAVGKRTLRIVIPEQVGDVQIWTPVYGEKQFSDLKPIKESRIGNYSLDLPEWASYVRVFLYNPKYKMIEQKLVITPDLLNKPFTPEFEAVPTLDLVFKVINTENNPVAVIPVRLETVVFFGFYTSMHDLESKGVWVGGGPGGTAIVASAITDSNGEFKASIPRVGKGITLLVEQGGEYGKLGEDWHADSVTIDTTHPSSSPIPLKVTYFGRLNGCIGSGFIARNGLSQYGISVNVSIAQKDGRGNLVSCLLSDGRFEYKLQPGTYEFVLKGFGDDNKPSRAITVWKDIIIQERKTTSVSVE